MQRSHIFYRSRKKLLYDYLGRFDGIDCNAAHISRCLRIGFETVRAGTRPIVSSPTNDDDDVIEP